MVILIPQAAAMGREELDNLGPVKKPISQPAAALTGKKYIDESSGIDSMGIWECSPGRWQRTVMHEEFAHFVKGSARFIPTGGEPIDIQAGDTIWFPANTAGVWEISEDVRKVYVIIDRPTIWRQMKSLLRATFGAFLSSPQNCEPAQRMLGPAAQTAAAQRSAV